MLESVIRYYLGYGQGSFTLVFFVLFYLYLVWKSLGLMAQGYVNHSDAHKRRAKKLVSAFLQVFVAMVILFGIIGAFATIIDKRDFKEGSIERNNMLLMEADRIVFGGVYPTLWMQARDNPAKTIFDVSAVPLLVAYNVLTHFIAVLMVFLFIFRHTLFLRFFSAFVVSMFLAMPFWYIFPAISPSIGIVKPIIDVSLPDAIQADVDAYEPNDILSYYIDLTYEVRFSQKDQLMVVTTIPSMHIAWATLITWYAFVAWRPSAVLGIPYFLLNNLSAVYLLQHYAVDIPAGIAIAALAILIVQRVDLTKITAVRTIQDEIQGDVKHAYDQIPGRLREVVL